MEQLITKTGFWTLLIFIVSTCMQRVSILVNGASDVGDDQR